VADARHVPLELAQLSGPDGSETDVAKHYLAWQGRVAEAGMRITVGLVDTVPLGVDTPRDLERARELLRPRP